MFKDRHKTIGFIGMLGLLLFYFGIVAASGSFEHAFEKFYEMWYYILILSVGFGIHVGLYSLIRSSVHKSKGVTAEVAASGGVSTVSMAACCAHHAVDVLPLVGLSAVVIYFTQYQVPLIMVGIFSNLLGITILLTLIQKHRLYQSEGVFGPLFRLNMKKIRNATVVVSIILISSSLIYTFTVT
jgi:hypothetical protein